MAFNPATFFSGLGTKVLDSFDPFGLFHQGDSGPGGISTSLFDAWDKFKNGNANDINYDIAQNNLNFQKERTQIEDQRYADETAYNRAWAEEEREYNRALQQTLFEREDTALERQASSLSSMGINPLNQQLNGLGAGAAVPQAPAPSASGRVAETPQNNFRMSESGMLPILSSMLSVADTLNGVKTGQYQRDALALQNDKQFLDNLKIANSLGIDYHGYFFNDKDHYTSNQLHFVTPEGKDLQLTDEYKSSLYSEYRNMRKNSMPSWQYTLDSLGQSDVYNQAENALTKMSGLFDKFSDNIFEKNNYSINPFRTLFNMFFGL